MSDGLDRCSAMGSSSAKLRDAAQCFFVLFFFRMLSRLICEFFEAAFFDVLVCLGVVFITL